MHTGDLATIDAEGYCNIVGRVKDMLIRGGENVYPREIEEFLLRHRARCRPCRCSACPTRGYGEEVCAWIVLKPGASISAEEIRAFCQRPDRALQGAAPRPLRAGVPAHRDRQAAEVRDARSDDARAGGVGLIG